MPSSSFANSTPGGPDTGVHASELISFRAPNADGVFDYMHLFTSTSALMATNPLRPRLALALGLSGDLPRTTGPDVCSQRLMKCLYTEACKQHVIPI